MTQIAHQIVSLFLIVSTAGWAFAVAPAEPGVAPKLENYGKLPLSFEANQGQTDAQVRFLSRGNGYSLFLTPTEAVLELKKPIPVSRAAAAMGLASAAAESKLPTTVLRMKLVSGNPSAEIAGGDELPGQSNYFIGNDLKKWVTGARTYGSVQYRDVYPGVDLVYYGNQRQLEHDFVVAPGADPALIALDLEGAKRISVSPGGDVVMDTPEGEVRLQQPKIYQTIDGEKKTVGGRYKRMGETRVGFEIAAYDRGLPLVIDPVLNYSTYLGGSGNDQANAIAVDSAGNAYVTGVTGSTNFPTANGAFTTNRGSNDAFVVKINAAGSAVVYSTYLGGSGDDSAYGIAVDSAGSAYITGTTTSTNFPTANALFAKFGGGFDDAFVAKINAAGSALVYSTYLGGNSDDGGFGIAVNSKGNAFITGSTGSTNFPTAHALYTKLGGADDAFVAELNAAGSALIYSTYLGGSNGDGGMAIALDSLGYAYVTGETFSANFPTAKALYPTFGGGFADGFVAKINSAGSALVYSTFLGGNDFDLGQGIAVDAEGNAYVTGETFSANFPTAHALYPTYRGEGNVFITKLNTAGSALLYSTYMGGTGGDGGRGIAVDGAGNAYVVGSTASVNFPTANAFYATSGGSEDAFVAKINAGGGSLAYSTYLGGSGDDFGQGIAVDGAGNAYVAGYTLSTNFPTLNALHRSNSGGDDLFAAKIFDSNAGSADVSLSSAAPSSVSPSANITYTIALSNTGPNLGNSVTLKDVLPAQTTFVSCSASGGGSCTNSGNNVSVNFPNLAKGAKATVTLVARVGSTVPMGSIISNTATVALRTFDPVIANNSSTATSAISAPAAAQQFAGPVNLIFKGSTLSATAFSGILGVADFNNDGREDILGIYYANNGTSQCAVLLGNSDGSYTPKLTGIYLGKGSGDTVEVADVDGDGRPDIIVVTAPRADARGNPLGPSVLRVYLGNGDGTFRGLPAITVSTQFASLALVEDLNKDGKPDLVISEHPGDFTTIGFRVWTNQGAGKFKAAYSVGSSTSIAVLAQGDFNRDGYPDIVMQVSAGLQIFLNNKGTGFTAGATYPIFATVAATGDLNHDGIEDLVAVESTGHNGHILLGKGDGTFRTGVTFGVSSNPAGPAAEVSPASVQIADLNGDGLPDISVVTYILSDASGGSDLQIFAGDGAGNVGYPSVFNIGGALQTSFVDVNRDGKLDLLLSGVGLNGGPVRGYSIAANNGPGFFSAPREATLFGPNSIVTADFNKDGNGDIAVVSDAVAPGTNGAVIVYAGSGQGYFNAGRSYAIGMPSGVLAVGDVNGDGKLDLVVARSAAYLANNALGIAAQTAALVSAVGSASTFGMPVRTAVEQQRWQTERYIAVHALSQVQRAASPDASSNTTDLSVLLGVGDGTFKPAMNYSVLGAPAPGDRDNFATLADVNHDGKLDLVGDWGAALGKGDGSFAPPISLASSLKNIVQMASGDINGDGGFDLAVATSTYPPTVGVVYALFGNGKGSFTVSSPQQLANTDNVYGLAIADINGDGKGDLIFDASQSVNKQQTSRNLTVRLLNGNVSFASPINYPLTLSSFVAPLFEFSSPLIIGDFNRDGKRDVLYLGDLAQPGKIPGGRLTLLLGIGDGRLSATPQYLSTQMQQGVVLNLNSDGAPDVAGITAIGVTRLLNSGSKATVAK